MKAIFASKGHVAQTNGSCHICEWVIPHQRISYVMSVNESCHTSVWVTTHMWMSHGTHVKRWCRTDVKESGKSGELSCVVSEAQDMPHLSSCPATHCNTHTATYCNNTATPKRCTFVERGEQHLYICNMSHIYWCTYGWQANVMSCAMMHCTTGQ